MIGKIQRVPLREVWRHEAYDFTTWLTENTDVLNDVLELTLTNAEREQAAGTFNVDIVAEDEAGHTVIIENQLEKSDHDHLGKLITYLTAFDAKTAIWIVSEPRPEHVKAIAWLNESTDASFYLLKVEAIKIANSLPAPLLTKIVGPSEEAKEVGEKKRELAERYHERKQFWTELLNYANQKTNLHASVSPQIYNFIGAGAGKRGLAFNYSVKQNETAAELYIDRGKESGDENTAIFNALESNRETIEQVFGGPLEWELLEAKRACRICKRFALGGYRDEDKWPRVFETTVDAMVRLEKALAPEIAKLTL